MTLLNTRETDNAASFKIREVVSAIIITGLQLVRATNIVTNKRLLRRDKREVGPSKTGGEPPADAILLHNHRRHPTARRRHSRVSQVPAGLGLDAAVPLRSPLRPPDRGAHQVPHSHRWLGKRMLPGKPRHHPPRPCVHIHCSRGVQRLPTASTFALFRPLHMFC